MSKAAHKEMTKKRCEQLQRLNSVQSPSSHPHEVVCWDRVGDSAYMNVPLTEKLQLSFI